MFVFQNNDGVNAAGALDYGFKIGVIARSRSTLGYAALEHVSFDIDNIPEVLSVVRIGV